MSLKKILTIGYEAADFDDFLATLQALDVDVLLDVRELAMSRRQGFAKTALRAGLEGVDIGYQHEPRLGSPRMIRHQLRDDGDLEKFFEAFDRHLVKHRDLLEQLASELTGTVVLMCYERDHNTCHRRAVAEAFGKIVEIVPQHRGVQGNAQRQAATATRAHPGQSAATA